MADDSFFKNENTTLLQTFVDIFEKKLKLSKRPDAFL